jgi:ATP-binding cassette, subfamily A (ABC1), member 3
MLFACTDERLSFIHIFQGKTTTMAMLTAEFPPTSGDATLAGFSVTKQPEKTRRRVGYCPQFDALLMNLTGREHVELYASIKGVPSALVKEAAALKLAEVGLSEKDSDRLAAGYSGGMKRRLSLATATIGNPSIVFLDGKLSYNLFFQTFSC